MTRRRMTRRAVAKRATRAAASRRRQQRARLAVEVSEVTRAAARLDDDELDRAWRAALRGDTPTLERTLARTRTETPPPSADDDDDHSKQVTPWRDSSWLFGRRSFKRTNSSEDD